MRRAVPCLLHFLLALTLTLGCRPSPKEPQGEPPAKKTPTAGEAGRKDDSKIPIAIEVPYVQKVIVSSVTIGAQDIPEAVARQWRNRDEIFVRIVLTAEVKVKQLPAEKFQHSVFKLEVGSHVLAAAGEHSGGMWGGSFADSWLHDKEVGGTGQIDLIFVVPERARLEPMRIVVE